MECKSCMNDKEYASKVSKRGAFSKTPTSPARGTLGGGAGKQAFMDKMKFQMGADVRAMPKRSVR